MTEDDLKRLLGMNVPLDRLSAAEFEALAHRIRTSCPEHKSRLEAILLRDLLSRPDLAGTQGRPPSDMEAEARAASGGKPVRSKFIRTLTLIVIAMHAFAVTMVLLRLLHR